MPPGGISFVTKFCYTGNPETGPGWNEGYPGNPTGSIWNCGGPGVVNGNYFSVNTVGDRRNIISSGADNFTVNPGDTQFVVIAQMVQRGTSNLNSVTKLKQYANTIRTIYNNLFGIEQISSKIPGTFTLSQNYPNPFNPRTIINFQLPMSNNVKLMIYDILGREVATLVNELLKPGTYEVEFDGTNYPSGVYFYKLITDNYNEARKIVLVK
jgi:hypothetical protein